MRCRGGLIALYLIAAGAGAATAALDDAAVGRLACRGNEPSWQLQIDGATATYQRLGGAAIELAGVPTPLDYLPRPELVWRGRAAPLEGDLVAWITEASCLDTMSDREGWTAFSHRIRVSLPGGEVLVGCCRRVLQAAASAAIAPGDQPVADVSAKRTDGWSRLLPDLAPALGGAPDRFAPAPAGSPRLPGEGAVVFSLAPQSPPAGACSRHERVLRTDGELLGVLSYYGC